MSDTKAGPKTEAQPRPKEFEPIEDRAEALRFLREGAKTFSSTMLWTKNQATIVNTHLKLYSEKDSVLYFQVPPELDARKFVIEVEGTGRECFFSISLEYANIFFRAKFWGLDKAGLVFHLPEQVFKVQRRKDLRHRVQEGYLIKAEYMNPIKPGELLTRKMFDLSAGGLSILTVPEDEAVYVQGLLVRDVSFTIRGKKITVDAEVRHRKVVKIHGKDELKVGLIFKNPRAADAQTIASYVFEESRRYFLRFL